MGIEFDLFRLHLDLPKQTNMFPTGEIPSREVALSEALNEAPGGEVRINTFWNVGDVTPLKGAYYFRFGRKTSASLEVFNEETKSFADQEFAQAPFAHVIC